MFLLISVLNLSIYLVRILHSYKSDDSNERDAYNKNSCHHFSNLLKRYTVCKKKRKKQKNVHEEKLHLRKKINSASQTHRAPTDLYPPCLDSTPPQSV